MPDGLKISNRREQLFYVSAWIARVDYDNEAFEDESYEDQQASDDERNVELLVEDYDEMALDEINEAEQFELNNIQEDDPEPECNNENNFEMNAGEIQDANEEPVNENENEESMIEKEVNPSTEDDTDQNVRTKRSGRVSRPPTKLTTVQHHLHTQAHCQEEYTTDNAKVIAMTSIVLLY